MISNATRRAQVNGPHAQAQQDHLLCLFLYHLILCAQLLPLPLGEVAERSEAGEAGEGRRGALRVE